MVDVKESMIMTTSTSTAATTSCISGSTRSRYSNSTGLLSLNVHEALNFDGTPICLHPDLFSISTSHTTTSAAAASSSSIATTAATTTTTTTTVRTTSSTHHHHYSSTDGSSIGNGSSTSMATTVVTGNLPIPSHPNRLMLNPTMSSEDGTTGSATTVMTSPNINTTGPESTMTTTTPPLKTKNTGNSSSSSISNDGHMIQVGDLIEICVWDPGGPTPITSQPPLLAPAPQSHLRSVHHPSSITETSSSRRSNEDTNSMSNRLRPVKSSNQSAASGESSIDHRTENDDNDGGGGGDGDDTPLPIVSSLSSSPLPPQPKPPTSTATTTTTTLLSKPPIPRRAVTTNAIPISETPTTTTATATTTTASLSSSTTKIPKTASTKTRHVREISDMTMETEEYDPNSTTIIHPESSISNTPIMVSSEQSTISAPVIVHHENRPHQRNSNNNNKTLWNQIPPQHHKTHQLRVSFCMVVTEPTLTSLKGSARTQISILRPVADLYHLSSYDMVSVHILNRDFIPDDDDDNNDNNDKQNTRIPNETTIARHNVGVDFLLVTIKDQFMSRGDMHYFQNSMIGHWIYQGQRLYESTRGFLANAREIRRSAAHVLSGVITSKTVITFRSRSSRIIWLVQMSSEMWDYGPPDSNSNGNTNESVCEIYFDKWITFIHKLFTKWKELEVTHALTVVFFSRTFISANPKHDATTTVFINTASNSTQQSQPPSLQKDVYGRYYEDHFRVVLENETCTDWHTLVVRVKEAFVRYPLEVGWSLHSHDAWFRKPSTASHGNVLEAINVTLNLLQFHYLDRDLQRTGNSIVVVSAGNGVFEVDRNLAGITYQRMMDNGIGSDMLSLGLPALHIAPFFLYSNPPTETVFDKSQEQFYEVPHWMHLSFVSYESDEAVFVDHLYDPKDSQRKEDTVSTLETGIDVAPNGFVLSSSYRKSPVVISSPLQQPLKNLQIGKSSGRQLIDGRDFQDILEACRPRHAGAIPSALLAVLRISNKANTSLTSDESIPLEDSNIEEWGTIKFESTPQSKIYNKPSAMDFTGSLNSRQLSTSPQLNTTTGSLSAINVLNPTSSFESQINNAYRSFSDENMHAGTMDRTRSVAQLQRSASLTLDADDIVNAPRNLTKTYASGASSDEEEIDNNDENSKLADLLRTMMRNHDSTLMTLASPKLGPKSEPLQPALTQQYVDMAAPVIQSTLQSGVGAALNQYRLNSTRNFVQIADRGSTMLSRTTSLFEPSGITGQASLRRMADSDNHRLSPLLLPPAVSTTAHAQNSTTDRYPPEIIPFERRLIKPQEYATNLKSTGRISTSITDLNDGSERNDAPPQHISQSLSRSPPKGKTYGSPPKHDTIRLRSEGGLTSPVARTWQQREVTPSTRTNNASRRKKMFNPFRQQDEDEVLAMKSHNRRRWSHVFPLGEVEFKRHAGPNWKSLTAPAILPLSIDYFPPQEEIDHHFTTGFHNVTLSEFENKNFSSNKDLLIEMARQRLTQDFQVVPEDCIDMRKYRLEPLEGVSNTNMVPTSNLGETETIRLFLSMGHILHTLTYYKYKDIIEVRRYTAKETQKNYTDNYQYLTICQETQAFKRCQQTFSKYTELYNWNKVDNIICGDDDREMREGMRFKRVMFGIVPDNFGSDRTAEDAYVAKFRRFLEYLEKLRDKAEASTPLSIKFVTSLEKEHQNESQRLESVPGVERTSMVRFYVQLRKGKGDILEWMEVALDATFDTSWTYRIMFNWLVASSGKVDSQVQLLQRRCTQYGLRLIPFPQVTVSRNVFLNPYKAPAIITVRQRSIEKLALDRKLVEMDYVYDGVFLTEVESILDCIVDDGYHYQFPRRHRYSSSLAPTMGKQFVHRSGTLFVRVLCDLNEKFVFVVLGNYRYLNMMNNKDASVIKIYRETFQALKSFISGL